MRYRIDGSGCSRRYSGKLDPAVTDAVLDEVAEWQNRPLDICHPLVFFDAIRVKIRDEGFVRNKAIYIALGILPEGTKEILGHFSANDRSDLHRSPDPPFHGFCLPEGSQEAQALRAIYRTADAEAGQAALDAFVYRVVLARRGVVPRQCDLVRRAMPLPLWLGHPVYWVMTRQFSC